MKYEKTRCEIGHAQRFSRPGARLSARIYKICTLLSTGFVENRARRRARPRRESLAWRGFPGSRRARTRERASMTGSARARLECAIAPIVHEQTTMNAAPPQAQRTARTPTSGRRRRVAARAGAAALEFPARHHRRGQPHRQVRRPRRHPLSARAQRLSALRAREVDQPQFRPRRRERRHLPPALRRHQSAEGGCRVRGLDRRRGALAGLRLGRAPLPRVRLLRRALRVRRMVHRAGPRVRRQPVGRGDARDCAAR